MRKSEQPTATISQFVGARGGAAVVTARPQRTDPAVADVLSEVAGAYGVAVADLLQTTRGRAEIAFARQLAMYLVHVVLGRTLTDIGVLLNRDRTTVAHACALIEDRRDDAAFDEQVSRLEAAIEPTTDIMEAKPIMETRRAAG